MGVVRDFARRFTEPIEGEGAIHGLPSVAASVPFRSDVPVTPPAGFVVAAAGYALFYDRDEQTVFYAMSWPHAKPPICPATTTTGWVILNRRFILSRQDRFGNWVFRCE